ncbi:MAG TPA: hypothetical protein VFE23_14595 [Usitatibacter sp.]|jgi:hypothetical protein|nr:hypothetical protein [Usitatibacter sp.]
MNVATLLHSYLFAWLFVLGVSLGSMANLMVQSLTGGRWVEPVRPAWLAATRMIPGVALLFIPLLLGVHAIYPWTGAPGRWLNVPFWSVRSVAYLLIWCLFAWGFLRAERLTLDPAAGGSARARAWSAGGLVVYTLTTLFASFDWIASLTPSWYSSGFGLLVGTGQMLSGAAFGIMVGAIQAIRGRSRNSAPAGDRRLSLRNSDCVPEFHDLGNLLLMYVLTWAYLAFTQFLIIWAEDIPKEIHWYVRRLETGWVSLAWIIVSLHFALPFLILLSRAAKRSPLFMGALAAALLVVHMVQVYWLVIPSVRPDSFSVAWSDPLALVAVAGTWYFLWRRALRAPRDASLAAGAVHG